MRFTQRVRYEQSWLNPIDKLDVEDFDGDHDAFLEAKIEQGVRKLNQDEKLRMFEFANREIQDGVNDLYK